MHNLSGVICERGHFGKLTAYGTFLKWILEEMDMKVWTRLKYPKMGSTDGLYGCINAIFIWKKLRSSFKKKCDYQLFGEVVNLLPNNL